MKAVIFDMDGTLVDFEVLSHQSLNVPIKARFGDKFEHTWDLHAKIVGRRSKGADSWSRATLDYFGIKNDELTEDQYVEEVEAWLKPRCGNLDLMPGAEELFSRLVADGYAIGIATSSNRHAMEQKLSPYPWIRKNIVTVVCGDDPQLKRGKPFPDIFQLAAERMGLAAADMSKIVVFEDSPFGVQSAIAAGMFAVAVPDKRMFTTEEEIEQRFSHARHILPEGLTAFTRDLEKELFKN